jgi:DNA replication protein DnaC
MFDEKLFNLKIPSINDEDECVIFELGTSTIFVGANGSGKTRLAVFIEKALGENNTTRHPR